MGLSYRDAIRLLGASEERTVAALDRLTGGLLLATSATGVGLLSSLFDVRGELARLSAGLVRGLGEKARGLARFDRSERLAAAHAVVVLSAYFEVLSETELPCDPRELELTAAEQALLAGGRCGSFPPAGFSCRRPASGRGSDARATAALRDNPGSPLRVLPAPVQ
ncbi:NACHT N-terminal helical domain 7-containing protein [Streptomyces chartreusis]